MVRTHRQRTLADFVHKALERLRSGKDVCIMLYGETGSGKTHTMTGLSQDLLQRLVALRDKINSSGSDSTVALGQESGTQGVHTGAKLQLAQLQLQAKQPVGAQPRVDDQQEVKDLAEPCEAPALKIRNVVHNGSGRQTRSISVEGLSWHEVSSGAHSAPTQLHALLGHLTACWAGGNLWGGFCTDCTLSAAPKVLYREPFLMCFWPCQADFSCASGLVRRTGGSSSRCSSTFTSSSMLLLLTTIFSHCVPHSAEEEALQLFQIAQERRNTAPTSANNHSSRSHYILMLQLAIDSHDGGVVTTGTLRIADLAGTNERMGSAGQYSNETVAINRSLQHVSTYIREVAEGKGTHASARESALTQLLLVRSSPCCGRSYPSSSGLGACADIWNAAQQHLPLCTTAMLAVQFKSTNLTLNLCVCSLQYSSLAACA